MVERSFGPRRSVSLPENVVCVVMDKYLRVLQPALLSCKLVMFASCHHVKTQPLVVEERWGWLLGRLLSLWNCQGFVVLECSKDVMWVSEESRSSFLSVELLLVRASLWDRCFILSRSCFRVVCCSRVSERKKPSLGLCLESLLIYTVIVPNHELVVCSYWQTNCSIPLRASSWGFSSLSRLAKTLRINSLASSNSFQQVGFPFAEMLPVLSVFVKAWNAVSAALLADPSAGCNLIVWWVVTDPVTCIRAHFWIESDISVWRIDRKLWSTVSCRV